MSCSTTTPDINARLRAAEPIVIGVAYGLAHLPVDFEDLCQELRVVVWGLADRFDPTIGVPWTAYVSQQLRYRRIDLQRTHGSYQRSGKLRPRLMPFAPEVEARLEPECSGDEFGETDWIDFRERYKGEPPLVLAIILRAEGLTMRQIGDRLGVCESRVSQMLSEDNPNRHWAVARLRQIYLSPKGELV